MKKINDYLTTPDLLCQLAEEASELAQGGVAYRKAERWLKRLEEAERGGGNAQTTQNLP